MRTLPAELQLQIIESAEWTQIPTLSQVCSLWRNHIRQYIDTKFFTRRYTQPEYEAPLPQPIPCFHRCVTYITHLIRLEDHEYHPCRVDFNDDVDDNIENKDGGDGSELESATEAPTEAQYKYNSSGLPMAVVNWGLFSKDHIVVPNADTTDAVKSLFSASTDINTTKLPSLLSCDDSNASGLINIALHRGAIVLPMRDTVAAILKRFSSSAKFIWNPSSYYLPPPAPGLEMDVEDMPKGIDKSGLLKISFRLYDRRNKGGRIVSSMLTSVSEVEERRLESASRITRFVV
ncbi:hypothetical protein TWF481_009811 [Arthrobotrys musiformis]|uniref:F-box domain-containing protein n=1 Tax=Arthrobotrys musiformis TaxID=47236 RepID=A0AAV9W4V8_9PEZI